ncbi:hypothetical protein NQ318_016629 [Aromia moschata]|uniref:Lipase domain-containing protein n=1 Tax=Aromia moschata TaxID=1265417 RepID=A0AAV8XA81_9CUCU|nr:hypothetical protein NQ318_016629 [Aromia moschata]
MEKKKEYYRSLPPVDFTLADAVKEDVTYKYFKHPTEEHGKILTEESVAEEDLDKSIPTVLLIHGWTTDDTSPWFAPLKDEYFKLGPHSIIYVNWSKAGNKAYHVSSANILPVGRFIAQFLNASGIPPQNIHLVGHSLGSHLASYIGKMMLEIGGNKIGRITALDPAGPLFENVLMTPDKRLCHNDADFVDVIHTDIQLSGYTAPIGHVDFYPNGGLNQPGCPHRDEDDNCSHARSTLYFIESLSRKLKAKEAVFDQINFDVEIKIKDDAEEIIFGYHVDRSARGVYYFDTHFEIPFLQ